MIDNIADPLAYALVAWLPAEAGGRRSGAPTAVVYAATCVFPLGGESEVEPRWAGNADQLGILLQEVDVEPDGQRLCKVDFLARDLGLGRFVATAGERWPVAANGSVYR